MPRCGHRKHPTEEDADPGVLDSAPCRNRLCDSKVSEQRNPWNTSLPFPVLSRSLRGAVAEGKVPLLGHQTSCIISLPSLILTLKQDYGRSFVKCYEKNQSPESLFSSHAMICWLLSIFLEIMILWLVKKNYDPGEDNFWLPPS